MPRLSTLALATLLWTLLSATEVLAGCVSGSSPSYGDVSAIQYSQNGYNSNFQNTSSPKLNVTEAFDCSTFWALFYDLGRGAEPTTYSQFSLKNHIGTFSFEPKAAHTSPNQHTNSPTSSFVPHRSCTRTSLQKSDRTVKAIASPTLSNGTKSRGTNSAFAKP
jgi:hypothetical protein